MYNHLPLYRDKALLCALAALGFFTLIAVAIGAAGYTSPAACTSSR